MKRTGEIVLTVIGAVVYALFAVVGGFMIWALKNEDVRDEATSAMQDQPGISSGDLDLVMESLQGSGWFLIILAAISVILGILSIVFMKGNSKPKAAGIILIVTAGVSILITLGSFIFSAIFFLIAGIMCLVRKAPQPTVPTE